MIDYINTTEKDLNENSVGNKRAIDTVEELKKLNSNPNLNEKNVIELMSEIVPLITKLSDVNYKYSGPIAFYSDSIAFGIYTFPAFCTLLHIAARFNCDKIAECLIKAGAYIHSKDAMLCTPLHYAAICGNVEVAQVLIANGAEVDSQDFLERTPLHYTIEYSNDIEVVKVLIAEGASVNAQDRFNKTPLHYTIEHSNDIEVVKVLIANGTDVNAQDFLEQTPLHYTIEHNNDIEAVKVLIANRANVNLQDKDGKTPLHYALEKDHLKVARLLINKGANQSCVPAYINKKSQEKGIAPAFIVASISAIVTPGLLYSTKLSIYAFTGATIASMILAGGIAFGLAYMWQKHEFSSMLNKVELDKVKLKEVPQPT